MVPEQRRAGPVGGSSRGVRPRARPGCAHVAFEPFFMQMMGGIEAELSARSVALTIQVVEDLEAEMAVYRRWWAEHRVDGVFIVDLRLVDPRVEQIEQLGLPAVIIGGPEGTGSLSAVWSDDAGAVVDVVRYLARLGHERIARVAGVPEFLHTEIRTRAFFATMAELSLSPRVVNTDYMAESGATVTRQLLSGREPPTAIVYDNDVLAVAGLGVAHEMGLSVPARRLARRLGRLALHPGGPPSFECGHKGHCRHGDARRHRVAGSYRKRRADQDRRGTRPAHPAWHHRAANWPFCRTGTCPQRDSPSLPTAPERA